MQCVLKSILCGHAQKNHICKIYYLTVADSHLDIYSRKNETEVLGICVCKWNLFCTISGRRPYSCVCCCRSHCRQEHSDCWLGGITECCQHCSQQVLMIYAVEHIGIPAVNLHACISFKYIIIFVIITCAEIRVTLLQKFCRATVQKVMSHVCSYNWCSHIWSSSKDTLNWSILFVAWVIGIYDDV